MRFPGLIFAVSVGAILGVSPAIADPAPADPNMPPQPASLSGITPPRADGPHSVNAFYPPLPGAWMNRAP